MVDWLRTTREEFEELVELLIIRKYERDEPGLVAQAVDGRGGDGGIDIDVSVRSTGQLVRIYQLKHFPEGFSGEWGKSRKPQITRSFNEAMKHHPSVWALVIPRKFAVNERKWVTILARGRTRVEFVGATELNGMLAEDPNAASWGDRNPDRAALEVVGRDSAALASPGALAEEVRRLAERADARSAYWGFTFGSAGTTITESIFAKRPDAEEREPLSIRFDLDLSQHEGLNAKFRQSMEFGIADALTIPPAAVASLEKIGPAWFAERLHGAEIELLPDENHRREDPTTVKVTPRDGGRPQTLRGVTTWRVSGARGGTIKMQLDGHVSMTWVLSRRIDEGGNASLTFSPSGHDAASVARGVRFINALDDAQLVELELDGHTIGMVLNTPGTIQIPPAVRELAEDLAYIEHELEARFVFPEEIDDGFDRIWARTVRRMLEGRVSLMPQVSGLKYTLTGDRNETLEHLLEVGGQITGHQSDWSIELYGETVVVGDVAFYHPAVEAEGGKEHLKALREGRGADRRMSVHAQDGRTGFRIYSPSRLKGDHNSPEPWGLTGIREHEELRD